MSALISPPASPLLPFSCGFVLISLSVGVKGNVAVYKH